MRKLATVLATLAVFLLPLTAQSADAKPLNRNPSVERVIDWD